MLDRVLEGQQRMIVDFNGKIDFVYTNLNKKFKTLSSHVKKLEMQVVQTREATTRQGALTRGVEDDVIKHHVNAIIENDFWQVAKEEKLQEGDFGRKFDDFWWIALVSIDSVETRKKKKKRMVEYLWVVESQAIRLFLCEP